MENILLAVIDGFEKRAVQRALAWSWPDQIDDSIADLIEFYLGHKELLQLEQANMDERIKRLVANFRDRKKGVKRIIDYLKDQNEALDKRAKQIVQAVSA